MLRGPCGLLAVKGRTAPFIIPSTKNGHTRWKDTSVVDGKRYWYRVRAFGNGQDTGYTPKRAATTVFGAPIDVIARPASPTAVDVIWRDQSRNEQRFVVLRSSNGGATFDEVGWPTVSRFRDSTVGPGQSYLYRVVAENSQYRSAYTATVSVTTPNASGVSTLTAAATAPDQIAFSWTAVSGATEYWIEASFDGVDFGSEPIGIRPSSVTAMDFERLDPDAPLFLRVQAYNGSTPIGSTNIASATTDRPAPDTPGFVKAVQSGVDVAVSWVADSNSEYFVVQRDIDGSGFADLRTMPWGIYVFTDIDVPAGTISYRVKAVNTAGESAYSEPATAGPAPGPAAPQQIPQRRFLISFYGADPGDPDSDGNDVFLRQAIHDCAAARYGYETLNTSPGNPNEPIGGPYRDYDGPDALPELLDAIDHNDDYRVTQAEIDAVDVRLLGWSLGAVEAITLSRFLNDTTHFVGTLAWRTRFHLEAPIPVDDMILIDPVVDGLAPLSFRIARPVLNNVQNLVNYYQRRGGTSRMDYYMHGTYPNPWFPRIGQYTYARSELFGVDLRGLSIRSNAVNTSQVRVDLLGLTEAVHDWTYPLNSTVYDGVMTANQVHHSTIVWWLQDWAVAQLG